MGLNGIIRNEVMKLTNKKTLWKIKEPNLDASARISTQFKVSPLLAQILTTRGIDDVEKAQKYLYPELSQLHSPNLLHGMAEAVARFKSAVENEEKIYIYGDYDVDGTTSTALLLRVIEGIYEGQAEVQYYIPDRYEEGYGLNKDAVKQIHDDGCQLLVTVDCGVRAIEEIDLANDLGLDVIVLDHHEPHPEGVPNAHAVVDAKLKECNYPCEKLAAVGVAFKFACALFEDATRLKSGAIGESIEGKLPPILQSQLDLVALGTVVDVVPLSDENRALAKLGLEEINKRDRIGIRALCDVSEHKAKITSYTLGYVIGPRLNAAGRLDTARDVVELLISKSYDKAIKIAKKLDKLNRERRQIEDDILNQAVAKVKKDVNLEKEKGIVLSGPNWQSGVIGIVASRIKDRYYRPVFLISIEDDLCPGSGRSIPEFHLANSLDKCEDLTDRHGGHSAAAGLTIKKSNISKFRKRFNEIACSELSDEDIIPKVNVDLEAVLPLLTFENVEELKLMEPFGQDNLSPVLCLRDVSLKGSPKLIGKVRKEHLKFRIDADKSTIDVLGWNMDYMLIPVKNAVNTRETKVDIAFAPEINEWSGNRKVQFKLDDLDFYKDHRIDRAVYPPLKQESAVKIVDRRNVKNKSDYIQKVLSRHEGTIFYVRDQLALSQIEKIVRRTDQLIGLCNKDTTDEELEDIFDKFNGGTIGAIGSCITLDRFPPTKHLVFCHPVPTLREFIKKCRPAFETEETTFIHLIYASIDVDNMLELLKLEYPTRDKLVELYQLIKSLTEEDGKIIPQKKIFAKAEEQSIEEQVVSAGLVIFEQIGLLNITLGQKALTIEFFPEPENRKELYQSEMYIEGEAKRQEALLFSDTLLNKSAEDIWRLLQNEGTANN